MPISEAPFKGSDTCHGCFSRFLPGLGRQELFGDGGRYLCVLNRGTNKLAIGCVAEHCYFRDWAINVIVVYGLVYSKVQRQLYMVKQEPLNCSESSVLVEISSSDLLMDDRIGRQRASRMHTKPTTTTAAIRLLGVTACWTRASQGTGPWIARVWSRWTRACTRGLDCPRLQHRTPTKICQSAS